MLSPAKSAKHKAFNCPVWNKIRFSFLQLTQSCEGLCWHQRLLKLQKSYFQ